MPEFGTLVQRAKRSGEIKTPETSVIDPTGKQCEIERCAEQKMQEAESKAQGVERKTSIRRSVWNTGGEI